MHGRMIIAKSLVQKHDELWHHFLKSFKSSYHTWLSTPEAGLFLFIALRSLIHFNPIFYKSSFMQRVNSATDFAELKVLITIKNHSL